MMIRKLVPETVSEVRHFVAIAGRVTSNVDQQAVAGAELQLVGYPPSLKMRLEAQEKKGGEQRPWLAEQAYRTLSHDDGHFYFIDLPNGDYEIEVTAAGVTEKTRVPVRLARQPIAVQRPEKVDLVVQMKPAQLAKSPPDSRAAAKRPVRRGTDIQ
jgi:hypothetical protein